MVCLCVRLVCVCAYCSEEWNFGEKAMQVAEQDSYVKLWLDSICFGSLWLRHRLDTSGLDAAWTRMAWTPMARTRIDVYWPLLDIVFGPHTGITQVLYVS